MRINLYIASVYFFTCEHKMSCKYRWNILQNLCSYSLCVTHVCKYITRRKVSVIVIYCISPQDTPTVLIGDYIYVSTEI